MNHSLPRHRRWGHSLRHSLKWRLVLLFLLLAVGMSAAFLHGMQKVVSQGWRDAARPLLADYVDRLAADIGTPPDAAKATALAQRLPISVRIDGPAVTFDTHPRHRRGESHEHGERGNFGRDADSSHLLQRTTADGHTISFGLGDLNWRQGPGLVGWLTLLALLVLTLLAYACVRHLLRPLDDIGAGAKRFGSGDFSTPIPARRRDELGELAVQINTMGQDIRHMLDAKRGLLLAISHELRSPLTRARLHTELLPDTADLQSQRSALLRDLAEMSQLISDLLESERLSERHAALNRSPVDVGALVQEVVASLGAQGRIVLQRPAAALPPAQLDAVRVRLLVRNLLDNALRHNPPEAPACEIDLAVAPGAGDSGPQLQLTVRDHGPGVDAARLAQLGEAFYRPDASRQRGTGGVGLGLHLCKLVAHAHGGSIHFDNAHPGLRVVVTLGNMA